MPTTTTSPARVENKTTPHNLEAEGSVIGCLVLDSTKIYEVAALLTPESFHDSIYGRIYAAILELQQKGIAVDFVTLGDAVKDIPEIEQLGGSAFIAGLINEIPTSSNVMHYARIVHEKAMRRNYVKAGADTATLALDEEQDIDDLRDQIERQIVSIGQSGARHSFLTMKESGARWAEKYAKVHGLSDEQLSSVLTETGFRSLDKYISFAPGDLAILAARPSMGKTALALNIALNATAKGKKVGFLSYEMTSDRLMNRIIAGELGTEVWKLQKGKLTDGQVKEVGTILDRLGTQNLFIDYDSDRRISQLRSKARRLNVEHDIDFIIVDYLQLIYSTERFAQQNRTQMVSHISNVLKSIAGELECPVLALSQLSRKTEDRADKVPMLSDLRESGEIEQDADVVMMLYRQSYYDPDCDNPNLTDVYIRKNRDGETPHVELSFDKKHMKFCELHRGDEVG